VDLARCAITFRHSHDLKTALHLIGVEPGDGKGGGGCGGGGGGGGSEEDSGAGVGGCFGAGGAVRVAVGSLCGDTGGGPGDDDVDDVDDVGVDHYVSASTLPAQYACSSMSMEVLRLKNHLHSSYDAAHPVHGSFGYRSVLVRVGCEKIG
jgi:hypothetical protein